MQVKDLEEAALLIRILTFATQSPLSILPSIHDVGQESG